MKKEFTINYRKQWDKNGAVYNQTINITMETLDKLKDILQAETFNPTWNKNDNLKRLYLKNSFGEIKNGYVFINLTQRDFFNKYLKLKLKDRNTCFCIINK